MMSCKDCIGKIIRILIMAATVSALVMNIMVYFSCEFLKVTSNSGLTIGVFVHEINGGGCVRYQNYNDKTFMSILFRKADSDDVFIQKAQMGLIAAMSFGTGTLLVILVHYYMCTLCCIQWLVSIGYMGAQFATTLVYLLYLSDYCTGGDCTWAQGADYNVAAQCLYLGAFILAGCVLGVEKRRREEERRKNDDSEQEDRPVSTRPRKTTAPTRSDSNQPSKSNKNENKKSFNWLFFKKTKKNRHEKNDDDGANYDEDDAAVSSDGSTTATTTTFGTPTETTTITPMNERPPWFASRY